MQSPPSASTLAVGTTVAHYRIGELLGAGGFGSVHRAFDTKLHRWVAIKVLDDDGDRARLVAEARAAASLVHPNVVTIHAIEQVGAMTLLVMELLNGQTLRRRAVAASLPQKVEWLAEIAEALATAHAAGIVHRDVKPNNVLVVDATQSIKILDFGIAKRITPAAVPASLVNPWTAQPPITAAGHVVGTLKYMAPEQLMGASPAPSMDQWAWGVVAYEILSGQHPAAASGASSQEAWILGDATRPIGELVAGLAPHVAAAVMRALNRHEDRRFPSMADVVASLRGADRDAPTLVEGRASAPSAAADSKTVLSGATHSSAVVSTQTQSQVHGFPLAAAAQAAPPAHAPPPMAVPRVAPIPPRSSNALGCAVLALVFVLLALIGGVCVLVFAIYPLDDARPKASTAVGGEHYGGSVIASGREIRDVASSAEVLAWIDRGDGVHVARSDGKGEQRLGKGERASWITPTRGGFAYFDGAVYVVDTQKLETRSFPFTGGVARLASHRDTAEVCFVVTFTFKAGTPVTESEVRCSDGNELFSVFVRAPGAITAVVREGDDVYVAGDGMSGITRFAGRRAPGQAILRPSTDPVSAMSAAPGRIVFSIGPVIYTTEPGTWPAVKVLCQAPAPPENPIRVTSLAVSADGTVLAGAKGTSRGVVLSCRPGEEPRVLTDGAEDIGGVAIMPTSFVYAVNRSGDAVLVQKLR